MSVSFPIAHLKRDIVTVNLVIETTIGDDSNVHWLANVNVLTTPPMLADMILDLYTIADCMKLDLPLKQSKLSFTDKVTDLKLFDQAMAKQGVSTFDLLECLVGYYSHDKLASMFIENVPFDRMTLGQIATRGATLKSVYDKSCFQILLGNRHDKSAEPIALPDDGFVMSELLAQCPITATGFYELRMAGRPCRDLMVQSVQASECVEKDEDKADSTLSQIEQWFADKNIVMPNYSDLAPIVVGETGIVFAIQRNTTGRAKLLKGIVERGADPVPSELEKTYSPYWYVGPTKGRGFVFHEYDTIKDMQAALSEMNRIVNWNVCGQTRSHLAEAWLLTHILGDDSLALWKVKNPDSAKEFFGSDLSKKRARAEPSPAFAALDQHVEKQEVAKQDDENVEQNMFFDLGSLDPNFGADLTN